MENSPNVRRFRTNPIEVAIFAAVTLIFGNSVYHLFYDTQGLQQAAFLQSDSTRAVASAATAGALNLELQCGAVLPDQDTAASKVRLTGGLCVPAADTEKLERTSIVNTANRYTATVFTYTDSAKFSTDYIPLVAGRNSIHIEFVYKDGRVVLRDVTLTRN